MTTQSQPTAAGQAAHTPTPWLCASDSPEIHTPADASSSVGWHIAHINGGQSFDERKANAAFIVRCVNSHAALVEALELFLSYDMRQGTYDELRLNPAGQDGMTPEQMIYLDAVDAARAALKSANQ